jgi:hypothetical protein
MLSYPLFNALRKTGMAISLNLHGRKNGKSQYGVGSPESKVEKLVNSHVVMFFYGVAACVYTTSSHNCVLLVPKSLRGDKVR